MTFLRFSRDSVPQQAKDPHPGVGLGMSVMGRPGEAGQAGKGGQGSSVLLGTFFCKALRSS